MTEWRRDIHKFPELKFEEIRTSEMVASKLNEFGMITCLTKQHDVKKLKHYKKLK